jgi:two-component system, OmpR family, alkaline phosphatase synthesis response regulator PhoP
MSRILIVDDERNIRMFVKANLVSRGFEVVEAESAEEGLERLQVAIPDALILDVLLPGMNGWELAKKMADDEQLSKIPVIMLTASLADANSSDHFPNIVERLIKPVSSDDLVKTVRNIVG